MLVRTLRNPIQALEVEGCRQLIAGCIDVCDGDNAGRVVELSSVSYGEEGAEPCILPS